ncbi:MAG: hypothetical protein M1818_003125 [Claussenomyces sp. TS43310]|nr:MAG: hypothetical protein M1818_003125 [Claussenomyces sp. TS43310]
MPPHSPKRRKLDHDGVSHSSVDGSNTLSDVDKEVLNLEEQAAPAPTLIPMRHSLLDGDSHHSRYIAAPAMVATDYKSSLFKLQLDKMIEEVQPDYATRLGPVNDILHKLNALIEKIEDREPLTIPEIVRDMKTHKIVIPFPNPPPPENAAYKLAYSKPSDINIVGSYALRTMVEVDNVLTVDMVVTMPSSILQEKDYLNYRYFYKRAYYIARIGAALQDSLGNTFNLRFGFLNGNGLQPILIVGPVQGKLLQVIAKDALLTSVGERDNPLKSTKCEIHIIPAAPIGSFHNIKLRPDMNAIRPTSEANGMLRGLLPTPFYNSTLRAECNYTQYLKLQHHMLKHVKEYRDACILGRTWLRQRGFGSSLSRGGFGHFEWSIIMASLLQGSGPKKRSFLSQSYSSYQLFKATLQYLSTIDLRSEPLILNASDIGLARSEFPAFYDGARGLNLLFKMSASSYVSLRDEAKLSVEMLNDAGINHFEAAFILRKDQPLYQFDSLLHISKSSPTSQVSQDHVDDTTRLALKIYEVLKEALNDRVHCIRVIAPETQSWVLNAGPSQSVCPILVGIVFEPANIERLVDQGPAAEDKCKATKFRKFWGEKADLRRFKDGSILESLVWSNIGSISIFRQIVDYILKRHIGETPTFINEDFARLLPNFEFGPEGFETLREAYVVLENDMRALEGLPLQLRQISAIGSQLRLSSVLPPSFSKRQYLQDPVDVVVQFEGSGRWPDDIVAIQRTKIALLSKLGELLEASVERLLAKLGLENVERPLLNCAYLDVMYPSGAVFRLRVFNEREQTLLDRQIKDNSVDAHNRENAAAAMTLFRRTYLQLPLHTQSLATNCTRFPLLSPTMRLVKMWFQTHMFSDHISDEIIELFVMRTFLQPYPWRAPSSATTGFLRTLDFLARWNWRTNPLIVDFSKSMSDTEIAAINARMEAWRKIDSAMNRIVLFVASNHDKSGTTFSDRAPMKVVAARMTALARSACSLAKELNLKLSPEALFSPFTTDYDFVVHISPRFRGNGNGRKHPKSFRFKNLEVQSDESLTCIAYDPVSEFVQELKSLYSASTVFFHNAGNQSVIGGLWIPQTSSRHFRVGLAYSTKPLVTNWTTVQDDKIETARSSILSEIVRLGGDMISRLDIKR